MFMIASHNLLYSLFFAISTMLSSCASATLSNKRLTYLQTLSLIFAMFVIYHSVAYVSRSGGMSNELNNIVCLNSDGVYEGVAIGGDRYANRIIQ